MCASPSEEFWALLACCPAVRTVVLADMAQRLQAYQVEALHREKLVSLGTLAAGLMHELHNPGSAAKRAASQLRENLMRLQQLSLRSSSKPKTPAQLECMKSLLEHALQGCQLAAMSSLEQADAEEAMARVARRGRRRKRIHDWTGAGRHGVRSAGTRLRQEVFEAAAFSDALNWLGALVSSVSLVCAIEESITRISELVMAVKKFAYDERSPARELDVHDSLQSTLTILGHKLRLKQIEVEKTLCGLALDDSHARLGAQPGVDQPDRQRRWTLRPRTGPDRDRHLDRAETPGWLAVSITDHGAGIPPDVLPRIFDAFFTTKPQGSGTGLGLEIVHRIVTQKFGGTIEVESEPGNTRFIRAPADERPA